MAICEICKIMFTLSLVELFVECELTLNTQFSIENLKEKSLIAQRLWLFICYKTKLKKNYFFLKKYLFFTKYTLFAEKNAFIWKKIFYREKYK